jgi:hypothetical protein
VVRKNNASQRHLDLLKLIDIGYVYGHAIEKQNGMIEARLNEGNC